MKPHIIDSGSYKIHNNVNGYEDYQEIYWYVTSKTRIPRKLKKKVKNTIKTLNND